MQKITGITINAKAFPMDLVLTFYSTATKNIGVFYNSFNCLDDHQIRFWIKDAFQDVNRVLLFDGNTLTKNINYRTIKSLKTITDQERPGWYLSQALKNADYLISWHADYDRTVVEQFRDLGSPYYVNQALQQMHGFADNGRWIDLSRANEKAAVVQGRKRISQSFKQQCAYAGLTLFDEPKPVFDDEGALTKESLIEWLKYSAECTINQARLFESDTYQSELSAKASAVKHFDVGLPITSTSANISSCVLTDNGEHPLHDADSISLQIDMNGQPVNLLRYLFDQQIIPQPVYEFYHAVEGQSVSTHKDFASAKKQLPYQVSSLTVPYYDEYYHATDSYAVMSFGGAHGTLASMPLNGSFNDNGESAYRLGETVEKTVVDVKHVFSVDADSFYPTLAVKLGIFGERYAEMLKNRLKIKHQLPDDKTTWNDEHNALYQQSLASKLILNSATGAANMHNSRSMLPLDNKVTSLRILGNLIIYELGTAFARQMHAKIISTNTDGIKIAFDHLGDAPTIDEISSLAESLGQKYGLHYEVKQLDRVMVKDSNNLLEWMHGQLVNVTGKLGKGYEGSMPLAGTMDHPPIVDMACTAYLSQQPDGDPGAWLEQWLNERLEKQFVPMQWCIVARNTESRKLTLNDQSVNDAIRVWLKDDGQMLNAVGKNGTPRKLPAWPSNLVEPIVNVNRAVKNRPSVKPYVQWSLNSLKPWLKADEQSLFVLPPQEPESALLANDEQPTIQIKDPNSPLAKFLQRNH